MGNTKVKYAPGMRIILRGEEWMVKKVETNSLGNQTLHVIGISQIVKDYDTKKYNQQWNIDSLIDRWKWFFDEVGQLLNIDTKEAIDKHEPEIV